MGRRMRDLTGQRFGQAIVLAFSHLDKGNRSHFKCKCDCGNVFTTQGYCLTSGHTQSCGCYHKKRTSEARRIDIIGQKFGLLTALKFHHSKNRRIYHVFQCDCGKKKIIMSENVRMGKSSSCGCLQRKMIKERQFKHGLSETQIYNSYAAMLSRCYSKKNRAFKYYGGRGIKVCKRYKNSIHEFLSDLGHAPSKDHSIDRIDNNLGYSCGKCQECKCKRWPANIRWATSYQQSMNTSRNRFIEFGGEILSIKQWSKKMNISLTALAYRLKRWSLEDAMTISASDPKNKKPGIKNQMRVLSVRR